MRRISRFSIGLTALLLATSGCYGPFQLTRKVYRWNAQAGGKWEQEFMFILLTWVPVYGLAALGDAVIFNSIEFWTGNNPVNTPGTPHKGKSALPQTKHLARGDNTVRLVYTPTSEGAQLSVEQFQHQHPAGSLHIEQRNGMTVGLDAEGQVLFTAQTMPDGDVLVHDAAGKQVASYSPDQVEQFLRSTHR